MPQITRHQIILMMQAVLMVIYFASGTKMSHRALVEVLLQRGGCAARAGPCTDMGALHVSLHTSGPCSKTVKSGRFNLH